MSTKEIGQLLEALRGKQRIEGMNDAQLARRLGISKALWSLIQSGEAEPGIKAVRGIVRAYPDLMPYVAIFLGSESRILNTDEQKTVQGVAS